MVSRTFLCLMAGAALCTASAASAAVNIDFGSQTGNLGPTAIYTSGGLTVTAAGYSDGFDHIAATPLFGKNDAGDEKGVGLAADPSNQNEIYWGYSHLGAFIELDVSALFGLVPSAQFFMGSTTGGAPSGEQWAVYGTNVAACGWFCTDVPPLTGFDEETHDLFGFGTYKYYDFYSLGTGGNAADGNVLLAGLVLPSPVPEPGTWALMLLGFGAIGAAMRRNRKKLALTQLV
ncbi:PEPxxWA-CTERM sorting domain-containing protein [Sphingomonas sp.]|uniref:PEPxxWA-CTERM sorting domain-containing protein n=1 Tax=Sphingomonas sp. TaxID=28214 RepID=UPI0038A969DF